MKKALAVRPESKLFALFFAIAACVLIALYASFIAHITIVYTHFFYIPILLAGIWYQRKAVFVALFFGIVHILVTHFSIGLSVNEFARAAIFLIVAYAVGYVSEREAEKGEELRESHEKLTRIIGGSSIPTFVINSEHKITHWNTALEALSGVKKEEVVGTEKQWIAFYPEKRPVMADLVVDEASESEIKDNYLDKYKKSALIEGAYEALDFFPSLGEEGKWLLFTAAPLKDTHGTVTCALETLQDLTERKQAEEEQERLLQELEAKTKELEQIVYITSHDLRSPLVNVQGFSKELDQNIKKLSSALQSVTIPAAVREEISPILEENIPEALQYIHSSTTKMDSLLSGLLRLSRLGRAALTIEKLDMNELISEIARVAEFQLKEKGAELVIDTLPPCKGDQTQINQVFSNLLDNALKYLEPDRPGVIKVSGEVKKEQAVYCIEDNGVGIAPEHQDKIFEIFYQLDPETIGGEGLGLTIVRKILERHNGELWVESEPGKGSRFFVALPAYKPNQTKKELGGARQ